MRLADLPTPCLVLDRGALCGNLRRIARAALARGVAVRIDMQAARSIDILRLALATLRDAGAPAGGIAVCTLADAEYFAAYDVQDILYATCVTPDRLDQVARLSAMGAALLVATDDPAAARAIAAETAVSRALIRVDPGAARQEVLAEIAGHLGARLAGLMTEAPHPPGVDGLRVAAGYLAGLGCAAGLVSADDPDLPAPPVTEWRAGAELFASAALTVLARVTGRDGDVGLRLDAGAVALGGGMAAEAALRDLAGEAAFGTEPVCAPWLEQSRVTLAAIPAAGLPAVGAVLRLRPPDPRLTAAAHDRYFVVDGSDEVVAVWPRVGGW